MKRKVWAEEGTLFLLPFILNKSLTYQKELSRDNKDLQHVLPE